MSSIDVSNEEINKGAGSRYQLERHARGALAGSHQAEARRAGIDSGGQRQ